jgi:ABC-type glycerol-3-phosphate transport system substrate-binding protein
MTTIHKAGKNRPSIAIGIKLFSIIALILSLSYILTGCANYAQDEKINGRIQVNYWEKWSGKERASMQKIVDDFNNSQDRIHVNMMMVSDIDRKTLVSIAGGDPPDVVGLWPHSIPPYADKNAIIPLDDYAREAGIKEDDYLPVFWKMCLHQGKLYCLPSTPSCLVLHWNKDLFKEAGLDPEKPPQTLQELDAYARKLTKHDKNGKITQMGFLPSDPGWWNWSWGYWFGGKLWNGKDKITCNSPENVKSMEWVAQYSKEYGVQQIKSFSSGFGNYQSPQNSFFTGKVAMQVQGIWMNDMINTYAPKNFHWGAAPFPSAVPGVSGVTFVEADILCIPAGAKHQKEAFEFIRFVNSQKEMEKLCLLQQRITPLSHVSDGFMENHPHPYIKVFMDLVRSPNAFLSLDMSVWNEYTDEMNVVYDNVSLLKEEPKQALDEAQVRVQKSLDRELRRFQRLGIVLQPAPQGR